MTYSKHSLLRQAARLHTEIVAYGNCACWMTEELAFTKTQLDRNTAEAAKLEAALNGGGGKAHARR
jgi:hypothetical protein